MTAERLFVETNDGEGEICGRVLREPSDQGRILGSEPLLQEADVVRVKQVLPEGSPGSSGGRSA
jgi:hypothetical protein